METTDNGRFARLDERTEHILARLDELVPLIRDYEQRLRALEQDMRAVKERQTIAHALQVAFTTIASLIAAAMGMRQ